MNLQKLPMPKLIRIEVLTPNPYLEKLKGDLSKYWVLKTFYHARFYTDQGVFELKLHPGWITDKRSGSHLLDWFIPKDGCEEYNAAVFAHDTSYSGWLSKALADNLFVRQGFYKSKEVSKRRAKIAHFAVRTFGRSYNMEDKMPKPYTRNREFESLVLVAN